MTTRSCSSPTLRSSTANWPTGWSSTIPRAPTIPSASVPRYPSSCNINPSAKGTGLIQGLNTYFADPYASWQRGSNENTNGLVRQYLPKSRPFHTVTEEELAMIMDHLNPAPENA
jgi:hypothetical protein